MRIEIKGSGEDYLVELSGEKPEDIASDLFDLNRKVLIITDDNIPDEYYSSIEELCKEPYVVIFPHGEEYKGILAYNYLLNYMTKHNFYRDDCIVAVGGGVISDLSGFAAATYMRGIDYYSVPTTLLSQVDASIGGKTGINFEGYKNIVGSFYPPRAVAVTPRVLSTLDDRQFSNGMAEIIKMAVCLNEGLFERLEKVKDLDELRNDQVTLKKIIAESVLSKIKIVEDDEKERNLRRLLNFGHTIGHGLESLSIKNELGGDALLHGECVAIGMLPMCGKKVGKRLRDVLAAFDLPVKADSNIDINDLLEAISHDKKIEQDGFNIVMVDEIGCGEICKVSRDELRDIITEGEIL